MRVFLHAIGATRSKDADAHLQAHRVCHQAKVPLAPAEAVLWPYAEAVGAAGHERIDLPLDDGRRRDVVAYRLPRIRPAALELHLELPVLCPDGVGVPPA